MKVEIKKRVKNFWLEIKYYFIHIYEELDKNHAFIFASGLTYNILLCIIPLILIAFSILGNILESQELLIQISILIDELIPITSYSDKIRQILFERINEFIKYKTLVGILGIVGLFFSASGLFSTLRTILNNIFGIERGKSIFIAKLRDFGMVILTILFLFIIFLINPIFQVIKNLIGKISWFEGINLIVFENLFFQFVPIVLTFFLMLSIYGLVPYRKMKKRIYFVSAFWATVLLELAKYGFSYYVTNIANYSKIYGNLAFGIVTALWLYIISLIFILAAIVGQVYREKNNLYITELRDLNKFQKFFVFFSKFFGKNKHQDLNSNIK